jgi:hypothetical protein
MWIHIFSIRHLLLRYEILYQQMMLNFVCCYGNWENIQRKPNFHIPIKIKRTREIRIVIYTDENISVDYVSSYITEERL